MNPTAEEGVRDSGAAYVFVRTGSTWTQQAYLKASNTTMEDRFGHTVTVTGDTVVIGAPGEDGDGVGVNPVTNESAVDAGAAYVFVRSGTTWTQQAYVKASITGSGDSFALSVAASGDTLVFGAPREDGSGTNVNAASDDAALDAGAASVLVHDEQTWVQQAYLKASNTGTNPGIDDIFGHSVAVSGNTVVIGAPMEDGGGTGVNPPSDERASNAGAAYVFVVEGTTWKQQAYLKASNTGHADNFGWSVAVSGDIAVVGAPLEDGNGGGPNPPSDEGASDAGAAYVFVRSGNTWGHQAYLKAAVPEPDDRFGYSVGVIGRHGRRRSALRGWHCVSNQSARLVSGMAERHMPLCEAGKLGSNKRISSLLIGQEMRSSAPRLRFPGRRLWWGPFDVGPTFSCAREMSGHGRHISLSGLRWPCQVTRPFWASASSRGVGPIGPNKRSSIREARVTCVGTMPDNMGSRRFSMWRCPTTLSCWGLRRMTAAAWE